MRIKVIGEGSLSQYSFEYDILRSSTVMMLKIQISKRFSMELNSIQVSYNATVLNNMDCIIDIGIKQGDVIVFSSINSLLRLSLLYGSSVEEVEVKPTATIEALKDLLIAKSHLPIDINSMIVIIDGKRRENDVVLSSISGISQKKIYFTYEKIQFHVHLVDGTIHPLVLSYSTTIGELRSAIATFTSEDMSMLVLEYQKKMISEDNMKPLYKCPFLQSNIIRVSYMCLTDLIHRVRVLEQKEEEKKKQRANQVLQAQKNEEMNKRNEMLLKQLISKEESYATKQDTQIENLVNTLKMLQNRLDSIMPHLDDIEDLKKTNKMIQERIATMEKEQNRGSLSSQSDSLLNCLEQRVSVVEGRLTHLSLPMGKSAPSKMPPLPQPPQSTRTNLPRIPPPIPKTNAPPPLPKTVTPPPLPKATTPPPLPRPVSPLLQKATPPPLPKASLPSPQTKEESAEQNDDRFIPRLRRAFAIPKLPAYMFKKVALPPDDIVYTLPPYSKM